MGGARNWRQRLGALIGGFDAGQHHRRLRGFAPCYVGSRTACSERP